MDMEFPWPVTNGEWYAFAAAMVTILFGLCFMFMPRLSLRAIGLAAGSTQGLAISEARSTMAGFYIGLGLCCVLTGQFWIYMALGFCWGFAAFGRLISILSDRSHLVMNWGRFALELLLAIFPLFYSLGWIG